MTATTTIAPTVRKGRTVHLVAHQLRYETRIALRNPSFLGFTIALPLAFLGIFGTILADVTLEPISLAYRDFFVPNVVVLALLSSCFASLGITLAIRRATGELKRVRGTPLPPWIVLAALAAQATLLGALVSMIVLATARLWWGVALPDAVPFALLLAVAAPSLAALGTAVATFIRRPENAPAATNLLLWPVAFISGTFTPVPETSPLHQLAQLLPVQHLNDAAIATMHPDGAHIPWTALAIVAAWGITGAAIAVSRFRWDPR